MKSLVLYFSVYGTAEKIAKEIARRISAPKQAEKWLKSLELF